MASQEVTKVVTPAKAGVQVPLLLLASRLHGSDILIVLFSNLADVAFQKWADLRSRQVSNPSTLLLPT